MEELAWLSQFPTGLTFLEWQLRPSDLSLRGMCACPFSLEHSALPHLDTFGSVHVDSDTFCEVSLSPSR